MSTDILLALVVVLVLLFWWTERQSKRDLARAVAKVASALEAKGIGGDSKADEMLDIIKNIYTLSNHSRGELLEALALAKRVTSERDPSTEHAAEAAKADKEVQNHNERQREVDQRGKPNATG